MIVAVKLLPEARRTVWTTNEKHRPRAPPQKTSFALVGRQEIGSSIGCSNTCFRNADYRESTWKLLLQE